MINLLEQHKPPSIALMAVFTYDFRGFSSAKKKKKIRFWIGAVYLQRREASFDTS